MQMAPPTLRAQGMVGADALTVGKHQQNMTMHDNHTAMNWIVRAI